MITAQQWQTLLYYRPQDFKNPNGLAFSIVSALDKFTGLIGTRPLVLSDFRPDDPRQHGDGRAVDTTFPGAEPVAIYEKALTSGLFTGVGIYINELDAVSFHFDTRPITIRPNQPDRWGGIISHPIDSNTGKHVRRTEYTAAEIVLDIIKKKGTAVIVSLTALALMIYLFTRP